MVAPLSFSGLTIPLQTEAAVLHAAGDIRIEMRNLPDLKPRDVLIEMKSGGICGSDMHYFADGRNGQNVLNQPMALGHEGAGIVIAGGVLSTLAPGTPVVIEPAIPCGECTSCRAGRYNICPTGVCFGSPPTNGLYARHVVVPESSVHVLPASISPEIGAVIEPLAVAVWAVQRAQVRPGHRVLVTGAGPIGLLVCQVAKIYGASEITITDVNDERLKKAGIFGATGTVNTVSEPLEVTGFDRLIECSGSIDALVQGIAALRPAARATVVGQARPIADGIPLGFMQRFEIDLVTAFRYANAFPTAIALVAAGQIDLSAIVTATYPLNRIKEALVAPMTDSSNLKVLVSY